MTSVETPGPKPAFIIERAKNILLTPKTEWARIDTEAGTVQGIYIGYILILAAIGPICSLIGSQLFPASFLGVVYRPSIVIAAGGAVLNYLLTLVAVFIMGLVIDALATGFGGVKDPLKAFKIAAYSSTAVWVCGILSLFPMLSFLTWIVALAGLGYGIYLIYLGLPVLMKSPQDKNVGYTAVIVVIWIVLYFVIFAIVGSVATMGMASSRLGGLASMGSDSGSFTIHTKDGNASIDLNKLQQAAQAMKASADAANASANGQAAPAGAVTPVATDVLSAMLPGSVAGYSRGDVSSSSGSVGGMSAAHVSASYTKGPANFTLKVIDLGSASGFAKMGAAMNINTNEQTGTSYNKVNTVNGQMITERYDTANKSGSYGVVVGGRFSVEAEGTGADMSDLKSAVAAIDLGKLDALSKH
jgi:hypothetical protein